jgi:hypothetical protein
MNLPRLNTHCCMAACPICRKGCTICNPCAAGAHTNISNFTPLPSKSAMFVSMPTQQDIQELTKAIKELNINLTKKSELR